MFSAIIKKFICLDLTIDKVQLARHDTVSRIELGFPHDFYDRDMVKALVHGGFWDNRDV